MEKEMILRNAAMRHHIPFIPLSWIWQTVYDRPKVGDTIFDDNGCPFIVTKEGQITNHPGDETMLLIANAIATAIR